jgi:hypothetical protein
MPVTAVLVDGAMGSTLLHVVYELTCQSAVAPDVYYLMLQGLTLASLGWMIFAVALLSSFGTWLLTLRAYGRVLPQS